MYLRQNHFLQPHTTYNFLSLHFCFYCFLYFCEGLSIIQQSWDRSHFFLKTNLTALFVLNYLEGFGTKRRPHPCTALYRSPFCMRFLPSSEYVREGDWLACALGGRYVGLQERARSVTREGPRVSFTVCDAGRWNLRYQTTLDCFLNYKRMATRKSMQF